MSFNSSSHITTSYNPYGSKSFNGFPLMKTAKTKVNKIDLGGRRSGNQMIRIKNENEADKFGIEMTDRKEIA